MVVGSAGWRLANLNPARTQLATPILFERCRHRNFLS